MADYETEEQQVEALKKWWKENGRSVIAGVVIGVGSLLGWKGWQNYQQQQAEIASQLFGELNRVVNLQQIDQVISQATLLRDEYSNTPYATLASLILAKAHNEKGELDQAVTSLDWVIEHSSQMALRDMARLRKARILIAQDQLDAAETLLAEEFPAAFDSLKYELMGDLYVQRGQADSARDAYSRAIETSSNASGLDFLLMKKNNLGVSAPANG